MSTKPYEYDAGWMIRVASTAAEMDSYLKEHPEVLQFLRNKLPLCEPLSVRANPDFDRCVYYYFVDSSRPNERGSKWQHQTCINIYGDEADLFFDILKDGEIGGVEVWHRRK